MRPQINKKNNLTDFPVLFAAPAECFNSSVGDSGDV